MPEHMKKRQPPSDETSVKTRVIMVLCGICILGALYLFFGDNRFPKEITYRNVVTHGNSYVIQHENP